MANRTLKPDELQKANVLLNEIRERIRALSDGNKDLLFAYNRKISKELTYDERGKPSHRKLLKAKKHGLQQGECAVCFCKLPDKYAVLDRLEAIGGYTEANTRLICPECDTKIQKERGYS